MVEFVTAQGVTIQVGRVPREKLDALESGAEPRPPEVLASSVGMEVWGDPQAKILNNKDPAYLQALTEFYKRIAEQQAPLIMEGLALDEKGRKELAALHAAGIVPAATLYAFFESCLLETEQEAVVELVLYQSTVTARGIAEADAAFAVTWAGKPVSAWHVPTLPVKQSRQFEDRVVAQAAGYRWREFCALPGAEQSAEVVLYRIKQRLLWLSIKK